MCERAITYLWAACHSPNRAPRLPLPSLYSNQYPQRLALLPIYDVAVCCLPLIQPPECQLWLNVTLVVTRSCAALTFPYFSFDLLLLHTLPPSRRQSFGEASAPRLFTFLFSSNFLSFTAKDDDDDECAVVVDWCKSACTRLNQTGVRGVTHCWRRCFALRRLWETFLFLMIVAPARLPACLLICLPSPLSFLPLRRKGNREEIRWEMVEINKRIVFHLKSNMAQ